MATADLILYNATFYTMDDRRSTAEALAVAGERVLALGTLDELDALRAADTKAIDLNRSTVVPGLIDAHLHFVSYSLRLAQVDLQKVPTLQEAQRRVAERVAVTEPGRWIRGGGWNCNLWGDGSFPHRRDLDLVAPDHPVVLSSKDGHSAWANSLALQLAGITAQTPDPFGGHICREESGQPTGILQENAERLVYDILPVPSTSEVMAACRQGFANAHRVGLTGIHDCEGEQALSAFQELHRRDELGLRTLMHIPSANLDAALTMGVRDGLGDDWLRLAGVKAFSDGALGSRSAWMIEPYEDDPTNTGIPTTTPEALIELVGKANGAGLSVAIHAIGDAANRAVLDAIAVARRTNGASLRNRIEHVQLLHPDDLSRLAELDVIASMQPIHATGDMQIADRHWGSRSAGGYAWRSLLDAGTHLAFGSDAPVEPIAPLLGIHAAVTRRRADGTPGPEGWYPEQRLTVHQAVHAYTMGAAYASGEETYKGSLAPGKLADLAVLDRDIFRVDPAEIHETAVIATMIGGKFLYQQPLA